jgi:hypothetical protein
MRKTTLAAAALLAVVFASRGNAQGALSLEGLGYPPGQFSARADGLGGGIADFDALSTVAPAALAGVPSGLLYFQYSPELRKVTTSEGEAKTATARFPIILGIMPMGRNWTGGLSASTFLDRSSQTSRQRQLVVGGQTDTVTIRETNKVLGAINDVRLALAWSRSPVFRVGLGGHVFSGSNRVTLAQIFPDSSKYTSSINQGRISYAGFAGSVGVEIHPSHTIGFALAARKGGDLRAQSADTSIGTGKIPDHYSASVMFEGLPGTTIGLRVAHDGWSSLSSLSSSGVQAFDGWDTGIGIEATGPRLLQRVIALRLGGRFRTLPFGYNGEKVTEHSFTAGLGVPLARDRAGFDFAFQHASRSAADIDERGFILSFGLRVSP